MSSVITPPVTVVRVNGAVRAGVPQIRSRIATETNRPFTGTYGVVTATCDIEWLPSGGKPDHPWLPGWPVKDGDPVTVDAVWPDKTSRRFTGNVLFTTFDLSTGAVVSRCVGREEWLNRPGKVPPLSYVIGPTERDGDRRYIGMASTWVTSHLARQAGFTAIMPEQDRCVILLGMDGSLYPDKGRILTAFSNTRGSNLAPYYRQTSWGGVAMEDPYAVVEGTLDGSSGEPTALLVDLGDRRAAGPLDDITITVTDSTGTTGIGVQIDGDDIKALSIASGTPSVVGTRTWSPECTRLIVAYDSGAYVMVLEAAASGETASFLDVVNGLTINDDTVKLTIDAEYGYVSGVQVARTDLANPTLAGPVLRTPRTLRLRRDAYDMAFNGGVGVVPYLRDRNVLDILTEQARCEWIDLWVDESGVLQVCDRDELEVAAQAKVLTDGRGPDLIGLPQNGFVSDYDGTPRPDRPYPLSGDGITTLTNTSAGYVSDATGPYVALVNSGSTAAVGERGIRLSLPIRRGEYNTFYAETRSTTGVKGMLRAWYCNASGVPLAAVDVEVGEARGGTEEWTTLQVKMPKAPAAAVTARVEAVNGTAMPGGSSPTQTLHFRNFTTYGPGVTLLALTARTPGLGSYSGVEVQRRTLGELQVRKRPTILYWDGGKENLLAGDYYEKWATPRAEGNREVSWVAESIDTSVEYAGAATDYPLNMREGTIVGGHIVDDDNDVKAWVTDSEWPITVEFVDHEAVKLYGTVDDTLPSGGTQVVTAPLPTSLTVSDARKQESTVQVRGYALFSLVPGEPVTREIAGGTGPVYTHDGGFWLQSNHQAGQVADKLQEWIENPRPLIDTIEVPLADINEGDRVLIHLTNIAGVTLDVKVVGIDEDHRRGVMGLVCQVLDAAVTGLTLGQTPDIEDFWGQAFGEGEGES